MGVDAFRKASGGSSWFSSDLLLPVAGGLVALIASLWLGIYAMRYMRQQARRS
jgi:hypothetical protein